MKKISLSKQFLALSPLICRKGQPLNKWAGKLTYLSGALLTFDDQFPKPPKIELLLKEVNKLVHRKGQPLDKWVGKLADISGTLPISDDQFPKAPKNRTFIKRGRQVCRPLMICFSRAQKNRSFMERGQ